MVPIGRHNFNSRRWFAPRVPFPCAIGPGALATAHRRSIEEERRMQVLVRQCRSSPQGAEEEDAARGRLPREMKLHGHYEKPSERRVREKAEAIRRARKLARKKLQREGLLPMKPRTIPGAPGRGGPARAPRF
jgi:small subunit ribosomal protein S21